MKVGSLKKSITRTGMEHQRLNLLVSYRCCKRLYKNFNQKLADTHALLNFDVVSAFIANGMNESEALVAIEKRKWLLNKEI